VVTDAKYQALVREIERLQSVNDLLRRSLFARKSERFIPVSDQQLNLFNEVDEHIEVEEFDPEQPARIVTKCPGRNPLPDHFPQEVEIMAPGAPAKRGEFGEAQLEREGHVLIGYETSERVEVRPAEYVRILQKRPKYRNLETGEITVAHARDRVLARSIADETLATDIILKKYLDHLPIYRQAETLKRDHNWSLSPATMGKWVERVAVTLRPLYDKLCQQILAAGYVQMDESGIKVLSADKPKATHKGWMWLIRNPENGAVMFQYDKTRSAKVPLDLLGKFNGILQVDGYAAYTNALKKLNAPDLENPVIRQVGCLAHIRRKFFEAKDSDPRANEALKLIQTIYLLEAQWRDLPPEQRQVERKSQLEEPFKEFTKWLAKYQNEVIPKSRFSKAINYGLHQWPSLKIVLKDGRVSLDNNGIENQVRPLALGRKNYLFAGNHGAAQNTAVLYSLLLSCKAAGVNPRDWLNDTLRRIVDHKVNRIEELLPSNYQEPTQDVVG